MKTYQKEQVQRSLSDGGDPTPPQGEKQPVAIADIVLKDPISPGADIADSESMQAMAAYREQLELLVENAIEELFRQQLFSLLRQKGVNFTPQLTAAEAVQLLPQADLSEQLIVIDEILSQLYYSGSLLSFRQLRRVKPNRQAIEKVSNLLGSVLHLQLTLEGDVPRQGLATLLEVLSRKNLGELCENLQKHLTFEVYKQHLAQKAQSEPGQPLEDYVEIELPDVALPVYDDDSFFEPAAVLKQWLLENCVFQSSQLTPRRYEAVAKLLTRGTFMELADKKNAAPQQKIPFRPSQHETYGRLRSAVAISIGYPVEEVNQRYHTSLTFTEAEAIYRDAINRLNQKIADCSSLSEDDSLALARKLVRMISETHIYINANSVRTRFTRAQFDRIGKPAQAPKKTVIESQTTPPYSATVVVSARQPASMSQDTQPNAVMDTVMITPVQSDTPPRPANVLIEPPQPTSSPETNKSKTTKGSGEHPTREQSSIPTEADVRAALSEYFSRPEIAKIFTNNDIDRIINKLQRFENKDGRSRAMIEKMIRGAEKHDGSKYFLLSPNDGKHIDDSKIVQLLLKYWEAEHKKEN